MASRAFIWAALCGLVVSILVFGLIFMLLSPVFDTPREYRPRVVYEPNPQPFGKKVVTPEVLEKASFQVLDEISE